MSKVCKQCGGTGIAINNKFCKCGDGKALKQKGHDDALRAVGLEPEKKPEPTLLGIIEDVYGTKLEKVAAPDPIKEMQSGWANHFKFNVGDWVEHGSLIGVVYGIDMAGGKVRFNGYKEKGGEPRPGDMPQGWVRAAKVKLAPLERFDNANQMLIDLALATGDKIWFEELTK